jgi:hypothetical protein
LLHFFNDTRTMSTSSLNQAPDSHDFLPLALIVSTLFHILLALFAAKSFVGVVQDPVLFIDLIPSLPTKQIAQPEPERTQIVSRSEAQSSQPDPLTRFLSDTDSQTDKQTIKRGEDPEAGNPGQAAAPAQQQPQQAQKKEQTAATPKQVAKSPTQLNTRLSSGDLIASLRSSKPPSPKPDASERTTETSENADYQAFNRSPGQGARFFGTRGSSDYLPDLPDGDITLLNTKANQYAVFVRRVALEVFRGLRNSGLSSIGASEISTATNFVTVLAIMSPTGELVSTEIIESSGSARFDRILDASARDNLRDPNPPPSAAKEDGNIHFIFKSRVWRRVEQDPRRGPREQRWVLLSTGLL